MKSKEFRVVVLISGNGSNLQAIIDQVKAQQLPVVISAVLSNKADAYGIQRAKAANIDTITINNQEFTSRDAFDAAMQQEIDKYQPDLIVLAGFMRILSDDFVNHYLGRMINIHPSLLPDYRGLNVHQRVLNDSKTVHGVSVHYVTPELDHGPVFLQSQVPVKPNDDADTLAKRVQQEEHKIYPLAIKWIAEKRLDYNHGNLLLDGKPLHSPQFLHKVMTESDRQSGSH